MLSHGMLEKVLLVGAAYVSKEAAKEAREVVLSTTPRCVLLELDKVCCDPSHAACTFVM